MPIFPPPPPSHSQLTTAQAYANFPRLFRRHARPRKSKSISLCPEPDVRTFRVLHRDGRRLRLVPCVITQDNEDEDSAAESHARSQKRQGFAVVIVCGGKQTTVCGHCLVHGIVSGLFFCLWNPRTPRCRISGGCLRGDLFLREACELKKKTLFSIDRIY